MCYNSGMVESTSIAIADSEELGGALTARQKRFVEEYALTLNAVRSAKAAGYGDTYAAIAVSASRLLKDAKVKAYLSDLLSRAHMGRDEILARLEAQARGSIEPFVDDQGVPDLSTDSAKDAMGLIQQIDVDVSHGTRPTGEDWESIKTRLRLYSARDALELLGKAQRMFADATVDIDINLDDASRADGIAALMARASDPAGSARDVTPADALDAPSVSEPIEPIEPASADDTGNATDSADDTAIDTHSTL